jgi:hypothetical protein
MNIQQLIDNLKKSKCEGFQIQKQNGIITSTWLIYKTKNKYYYFDINQKLEFIERYSYTENEILSEFKNANFNIEELIN